VFAAERTYAAWVRTALAALASGVGARALLEDVLPLWLAQITGTVLILFAAFCLCAAVWREFAGVPKITRAGQSAAASSPPAAQFLPAAGDARCPARRLGKIISRRSFRRAWRPRRRP